MFCPNCGKLGDGNFCVYCGAPMETNWQYADLEGKAFDAFQNAPVLRLHYALLEKEMALYPKITKARDYFGHAAEQFIGFAMRDMAIARDFYALNRKYKQPLPEYYTFKHLAILYENRREYDKAIAVCQKSLAEGYRSDGTKGGMQGRLDRLKKLKSAVGESR
mgnify:CR=1 FL=1